MWCRVEVDEIPRTGSDEGGEQTHPGDHYAGRAASGIGCDLDGHTLPSPSLGPPLLSPSWSPPSFCGTPAGVGGGAGGACAGGICAGVGGVVTSGPPVVIRAPAG